MQEQEYKLGKYTFIFPKNLSYETFSDIGLCGISFLIEGNGFMMEKYSKYQVVDNIYLGFRLIIRNKNGWHDIPFKKETFTFLPRIIKIIEEE